MTTYTDPLFDPRLRPYLKDVQAWHGYVRFLGLPTLQDHPDTPMHELFVPPLLAKTFVSPDMAMAHWPKSVAVLPTLREARRLVVLGDPGGGKTTLVNWLAWLLVSGVEERVPDWLQGFIPLPLVLREMELGGVDSFDGLLDSFLKRPVAAHLRGQKALLVEWLQAGRVLVLVDGLDEVGSGQREGLRRALWQGFEQYPNSYFLATSRVVGYEECQFDREDVARVKVEKIDTLLFQPGGHFDSPTVFLHTWMENGEQLTKYGKLLAGLYYVAPFDDDRIRAFAKNWYRLRALKAAADSDAEQFIKALFRDETTHRLARNPQLLTLMALVFRVRAHLPDGRALLYDMIAEAYLESIDKARHINTSAADIAPWREKRRWLARVGFEMQYLRTEEEQQAAENEEDKRELLASRTDVLGWLAAAMDESGYSANAGFVDSYLHWVARRSGLLLPRGKDHDEEQFAFVHLSFQEYFAAVYLCEYLADADWVLAQRGAESGKTVAAEGDSRVTAANLRTWAKDTRWQETLVFCFEAFAHQPKDAKRLLGWVYGDNYQDFLSGLQTARPFQRGKEKESINLAELLSRIMTNPHAGLKPIEREAAFDAVWQYMEIVEQRFSDFKHSVSPKVLSRLLSAEDWAERFWQRLFQTKPTILNVSNTTLSDLTPLAQLTELKQLSLNQTAVNDLTPLVQLTGLQALYLNQTTINDFSPLARLTGLQALYLNQTAISDLTPLVQLIGLRRLFLNQTAVCDLAPLAQLTGLQELFLNQTAVSDLAPLAQLTDLQTLYLNQTAVSDLAPLAQLTSLDELCVDQTAVSDFAPLAQLTGLDWLSLEQTAISDLAPLAQLTGLKYLFLVQTAVIDLAPLAQLSGLMHLYLSQTPISDLSPLTQLPNLQYLNLEGVQAPIPPALRKRKGLTIFGP